MSFMRFIARELREIMAKLGVRTLEELVGRTDLLRIRTGTAGRGGTVDLSRVLADGRPAGLMPHFAPADVFDFRLQDTLDMQVLLPAFEQSLRGGPTRVRVPVSSTDRAFGTILGSEITRRLGAGVAEDAFTVDCEGGGGQSFGAFIPRGLTLRLEGDANDYFGKGLSGGRLCLMPPKGSGFAAGENVIVGNVALYGATSGSAFIAGVAGERFCVRNSGAVAVVEGVGDHGCEYMTGGRVVVLGSTGKNFAAGMSGGIAYVLDERHEHYLRLHKELFTMTGVTDKHDAAELRRLIEAHVAATGSERATAILALTREQAEMEAFYAVSGQAEGRH